MHSPGDSCVLQKAPTIAGLMTMREKQDLARVTGIQKENSGNHTFFNWIKTAIHCNVL